MTDLVERLKERGVDAPLARFFVENYDFPDVDVDALAETLKPFSGKLPGWYPELYFPRQGTEERPQIHLGDVMPPGLGAFSSGTGTAERVMGLTSNVPPYDVITPNLLTDPDRERLADVFPHEMLHRGMRLSGETPPALRHSMRPPVRFDRWIGDKAVPMRIPPASSVVQQYVNQGYTGEELAEEHLAHLFGRDALMDLGRRVWDEPAYRRTFREPGSREAYLRAAFGHTPRMTAVPPSLWDRLTGLLE